MSAKELLKQVSLQLEQLPPDEREESLDSIASLEQTTSAPKSQITGKSLAWPDIRARHQRIFGNVVLAENIVLAAREEEDS